MRSDAARCMAVGSLSATRAGCPGARHPRLMTDTTLPNEKVAGLRYPGAHALGEVADSGSSESRASLRSAGGGCPRCAAGRAAHVGDFLLRKFAHLSPPLRRPKNVSHLINAASRPALDEVAHLWIADQLAERAGKVRPHDGERSLPHADRFEGQPRCDLKVVECT